MFERRLIYKLETADREVAVSFVGLGPSNLALLASLTPVELVRLGLKGGIRAFERDVNGAGHFSTDGDNQQAKANSPAGELATVAPEGGLAQGAREDFLRFRGVDDIPSLAEVAELIREVRAHIGAMFEATGDGEIVESEVAEIHLEEGGARLVNMDGTAYRSRNVVVGTGSKIELDQALCEASAGPVLDALFAGTSPGIAQIGQALERSGRREVVLVASSHSFNIAPLLVDKLGEKYPDLKIKVLHLGESIPIFAENEAEWNELSAGKGKKTVCQTTRRVNRWDGLRNSARAAFLQVQRGEGRYAGNIELQSYNGDFANVKDVLGAVACTVQGYGWKARVPRIFRNGQRVNLRTDGDGRFLAVDEDMHLLDGDGQALEGVFATGFGVNGPLHREISGSEDVPIGVNVFAIIAKKIKAELLNVLINT